MAKEKNSNAFMSTGVLDEAAMLAYIQHQLSAEEIARFEKLLHSDPFAQEALEGLQVIEDKTVVQAALQRIKSNVSERSGQRKTKIVSLHWTTYATAAVMLGLLIGLGFVMIHFLGSNKQEIALNKEQQPSEIIEGASESNTQLISEPDIPAKEEGVSALSDTSEDQEEVSPRSEMEAAVAEDLRTEKKATTIQQDALRSGNTRNTEVAQSAPVAKTVARKPLVDDKLFTTEPTGANEQKISAAPAAAKQRMTTETQPEIATRAADANAKRKTADMESAMRLFNSGDYKSSSDAFDELLKNEPDNVEAQYYSGISDYINGNTRKSEKTFDKLLKSGKGYQDGSKWYKANLLIKKGKKDDAVKLLKELAGANNSYKERAVNKLEELGVK